LVVHDGAGLSCAASLALDPKARTAAVVLSNTGRAVADISRHLLRRDYPLSRLRPEILLDPAALDRYVGQYEPRKGLLFDVRRVGDRLTVDLPVTGRLRMRATSEWDFFVPELGFEFRFTPKSPVNEILFRANAAFPMMPAKKVGESAR
jgi:hypothetical protein